MTKTTITQEQRDAIEAGWIRRAITQNVVPSKAPGVKYLTAELEYFVGAMNACEVLGLQAGARWTVLALTGQPIVDINKVRNAQIEAERNSMTQQITRNLRRAIEIFEAFPEERLNLRKWASHPGEEQDFVPEPEEHDCSTLFCGAGWLATLPEFLDQLRTIFGDGIFQGWGFKGLANAMSDSEEMFGEDPFSRLFSPAGSGGWDDKILDVRHFDFDDPHPPRRHNPLSDKDLLLARLRRQLALYESAP